jgi:hypothetical protein
MSRHKIGKAQECWYVILITKLGTFKTNMHRFISLQEAQA